MPPHSPGNLNGQQYTTNKNIRQFSSRGSFRVRKELFPIRKTARGSTFLVMTPNPVLPDVRRGVFSAYIPFLCCLIVFGAVCLSAVLHKGLTYDEANHLNYGNQLAFGHSSARPINSVMPATALNALGMKVIPSLTGARAVTVLFSCFTAAVVFLWAFELYGLAAAYLAGLLYLCCPNILAHSGLVTTDIYAAGTVLLAMYSFWRLLNQPGLLHLTLCAVSLGLALLAKYTCVALGPIFVIILAVRYGSELPSRLRAAPHSGWRLLCGDALRFAGYACIFALVAITVINAGNLFEKVFVPLADFPLKSETFSSLLSKFPWLGPLPVPTSFAWFQGLDWVLHDSKTGAATPNLYLFGEMRDPTRGESFTGYYFLVSLFKVPIATQIILFAALIAMLWRRPSRDWLRNELFMLVPLLYFFYFFNFSMRTQVGLRHFLVAFPLAFVLAGGLLAKAGEKSSGNRLRIAAFALILLQVVSVARFYPHFIPYVNEFIADRRQAYKVFADSNLAWGGDDYYLKQYLAAHPEAVFEPKTPTAGTIVVETNNLVGIIYRQAFAWLRENFEPVDFVAGGAYLVYEVPADRLALPASPASPGKVEEEKP